MKNIEFYNINQFIYCTFIYEFNIKFTFGLREVYMSNPQIVQPYVTANFHLYFDLEQAD